MKKNQFYVILLAVAVAGCSGGNRGPGTGGDSVTDTGSRPAAASGQMVEIQELESKMISRSIEYTSTLKPFEEIHLAPVSPSRIEAIYVEIGDPVRKGDLLVQMDRTQLHQAMIQMKNLETDFRRLDTLNQVGSISKQRYDQVKAQYEIASSNVEFLQENTVLRAPFKGVISGKYYEDGEFYSGTPVTPAGKSAIISIVQLDPMKAELNLSEKYFPLIREGMDATVTCDVYPEQEFHGKVIRVYPVIDPATRSFTLEIRISNEGGRLRPGMFGRVSMELGEEQALVVPAVAVLKLQGSNTRYVFVEQDGIARRVNVQIGKRFDDLIELISDELSAGMHLIVTGQARLIDGDSVTVVTGGS